MHISDMSATIVQSFRQIVKKLWEKLIIQTVKRGRTDRQTDGPTGVKHGAPVYRHGGYKNEKCCLFNFSHIQSTLITSSSVISNNRLSRRENLILVLT